jgi:hypothetical protein
MLHPAELVLWHAVRDQSPGVHGPESQVRTAPTPGGRGRPEGPKPPLRVSYAAQKPAGTPPQWVAAGGGRI